jgi:HD superfamily phosphohydrolase/adenine-specific DNA methylase
MNPKRSENIIRELENWVDDLGLNEIRESDPVQRLKKIRFLGTMQYITDLKSHCSRYQHSLLVSKLAERIGAAVGLSFDIRRLLVLMGLLHDIGHLPFSHASEPFFRRAWGRYHTAQGSRLCQHIAKVLRLSGNKKLATKVIEANSYLSTKKPRSRSFEDVAINEIYHGVLSSDTLDGITRAAKAIGIPAPDPLLITSGITRKGNALFVSGEAQSLAAEFLYLKKHIYENYVYSPTGIAAEAMLTRALELTFSEFTEKGEFLSLDDIDTVTRLKENRHGCYLMNKLESKRLFCVLGEAAPEKQRRVVALFERLCRQNNPLDVVRTLEDRFSASVERVFSPYVIIHPSILLSFDCRALGQQNLINTPLPLSKIARQFRTKKSYGISVEVVFPEESLEDMMALPVPKSLVVTERPKRENVQARVDRMEKHRGIYTTPHPIARFLVEWAVRTADCNILDPSSGEGVFLKVAWERLRALNPSSAKAARRIFGIESDPSSHAESLHVLPNGPPLSSSQVLNEDFFRYVSDFLESDEPPTFDAITGNPPYIRAHRFQGVERKLALECAEKAGVDISQRGSSWAPYVICATTLLKASGRLAMVLPVELLSTDYALPVRQFLLERFRSLNFVLFKKLVFPSVQEDVLLLLASNNPPYGVWRTEVEDEESLGQDILSRSQAITGQPEWLSDKWTNLIVDQETLGLLSSLLSTDKLKRLVDIGSVSLGQVTGKNKFFLLSARTAKEFGIDKRWLAPVVAKASSIPGVRFSEGDWRRQMERNERSYILRIPTTSDVSADEGIRRYLQYGKREEVDRGHKCRTRWPWYSVPMQPPPDAFMTYMSGSWVRLVLNLAQANSTNTIHNITFKGDIDQKLKEAYVVSFYSSLTALSAEILGRVYGGGVLKLELGEARRIVLPDLHAFPRQIIRRLRSLTEELDRAVISSADAVFEKIDNLVLREGLGLSKQDVELISTEKNRLSRRRWRR